MDIELKIDENIENEKIVIYAKKHTQEINDIINKISMENTDQIIGFIDSEVYILNIPNSFHF